MNRKIFIGLVLALLGLTNSKCKEDDMQFTQQGIILSFGSIDTTPDGKQVFGVVGDSNADGRGATIPTVSAATLYNSDGSTITEITTQSVANDDNTKGSIWQQFATNYKSLTGYKTVLVNGASGGAEFYPNGDNNNWYSSGTLYAAWKTKMDNTLTLLGLSKPKGILMNLGLNDCRSANSITDIRTGIDYLINLLQTDYPGVEIYLLLPGKSEGDYNGLKYYQVRHYLRGIALTNEKVHCIGSAASMIAYSNTYQTDLLHYTQTMNDYLGNIYSKYIHNSDVANKMARAAVSWQFGTLNTNQRQLLADFVTNIYNDGNFELLEFLYLFRVKDSRSAFVDLTMLGYVVAGSGFTVTADDYAATDGTTTNGYFACSYLNSLYTLSGAGQNDFFTGVKLNTRVTASGSNGIMLSRVDSSGNVIRIGQSTTSVNYHGNVLAANQKNAADAALATDTFHSVARNGGTMYYLKNDSVNDSSVQASSGACSGALTLGLYNNNGTFSFGFNATYHYMVGGKYSTFDMSSFYTEIEYLIDHWND